MFAERCPLVVAEIRDVAAAGKSRTKRFAFAPGEEVASGRLLVRSTAVLLKNSDLLSGLKIRPPATRSRAGRWWSPTQVSLFARSGCGRRRCS